MKKEEIIDKLEQLYHEAELNLSRVFAKNDYSDSGWLEWDKAMKLRDLAYDAYVSAIVYREED